MAGVQQTVDQMRWHALRQQLGQEPQPPPQQPAQQVPVSPYTSPRTVPQKEEAGPCSSPPAGPFASPPAGPASPAMMSSPARTASSCPTRTTGCPTCEKVHAPGKKCTNGMGTEQIVMVPRVVQRVEVAPKMVKETVIEPVRRQITEEVEEEVIEEEPVMEMQERTRYELVPDVEIVKEKRMVKKTRMVPIVKKGTMRVCWDGGENDEPQPCEKEVLVEEEYEEEEEYEVEKWVGWHEGMVEKEIVEQVMVPKMVDKEIEVEEMVQKKVPKKIIVEQRVIQKGKVTVTQLDERDEEEDVEEPQMVKKTIQVPETRPKAVMRMVEKVRTELVYEEREVEREVMAEQCVLDHYEDKVVMSFDPDGNLIGMQTLPDEQEPVSEQQDQRDAPSEKASGPTSPNGAQIKDGRLQMPPGPRYRPDGRSEEATKAQVEYEYAKGRADRQRNALEQYKSGEGEQDPRVREVMQMMLERAEDDEHRAFDVMQRERVAIGTRA